jgi:magnesium transporter
MGAILWLISPLGACRRQVKIQHRLLSFISQNAPESRGKVESAMNQESVFNHLDAASTVHKKSELTLLCHELDSTGLIRVTSGRYKKSELCLLHGLQPRDLRKLDGTLKNQLPAVLVRDSAILVNLEYIKAIIKKDSIILFESLDLNERCEQNFFLKELQATIKTSKGSLLPFEFQILEFILQKICSHFQLEFDNLLPEIEGSLMRFDNYVHWDRLKLILDCKKKINHFKSKVSNYKDAISDVLNSDDDMAAMYLSSKTSNRPRPISAHEEIELLLENYLKMADEIVSRLEELSLNMESTEDIVNIGLVGQRNELLLLELKLTIGTFAASMGGFGAGLFGMNLHSHLETSPWGFYLASSTLLTISIISFTFAWKKMKFLVKKY